jgi:hypothetical protein
MTDNKQKPQGLAIASMVCGIASFLISYFGIVSGTVAIILGSVALSKIKKGEASGRGMALAGLVTGIVAVSFMAIYFVYAIFAFMSLNIVY